MATKLHKKIGTVSYFDLKHCTPKSTVVRIAWQKRRKFNELAAGSQLFKKQMFLEDYQPYPFFIGVSL
jgi:hypothetical protein